MGGRLNTDRNLPEFLLLTQASATVVSLKTQVEDELWHYSHNVAVSLRMMNDLTQSMKDVFTCRFRLLQVR